jgi:hypothetical protein
MRESAIEDRKSSWCPGWTWSPQAGEREQNRQQTPAQPDISVGVAKKGRIGPRRSELS